MLSHCKIWQLIYTFLFQTYLAQLNSEDIRSFITAVEEGYDQLRYTSDGIRGRLPSGVIGYGLFFYP